MNIPNTSGPPIIATVPERTPARVAGGLERSSRRIPQRGFGIGRIRRDRADRPGQDDPLSLRRVRLVLIGIAAMHDQVGAIEGGGEKLLVALEFQFVRHHASGVRQHAVRRHDDIAVNAQTPAFSRGGMLFRNRLHHAGDRPRTHRRQLGVLQNFLVILRQGLHRGLRHHFDDLVAAGLQFAQQFGQGFRGVLVEIVHQDDAFAELVELLHRDVDHLLGVARLEIEGVEVAGEHRDIPGAEIGHHFRRVLQRREAEEWRGRNAA